LLLVASACKGKAADSNKQPTPSAPSGSAGSATGSAGSGSADAGSAGSGSAGSGSTAPAAGGSRRVDLKVEGNKSGESNLTGTIEVPADAVLDFGRSRGPDDLPVDSVFVKTGGISVVFDEPVAGEKRSTLLADYLKHEKVKDADILHKVEREGGFAVASRQGKVVAVTAVYPAIDCGISFDAPEADAAKVEAAFKICASYVPAPK
jgi:hypothetical protein